MLSKIRRMFARRAKHGSPLPAEPTPSPAVLLNYAKLEPRIVLDASFTLAGGLLTLDNVNTAGTTLSISEGVGNSYIFTLSTGNWAGVNGGGISGSGTSQLTAQKNQVDGLRINDNLAVDFNIQFTTAVNFTPLSQDLNGDLISGDLQIIGVNQISQAAGADITVESFDATATTVTLNDADNDFDSLRLSGSDASVTDTDAVLLLAETLTNNFELQAGGAVTASSGAQISVGNQFSLTATSISLADNATDLLSVGGSAVLEAGTISIGSPGSVNFLQLQVTSAGNVEITEDSDTEFSGINTADNLTVTSAGSIRDAAATQLSISGNATGTATNDIVLSDNAGDLLAVGGDATWIGSSIDLGAAGSTNFGQLRFSSTGAVSISEDSATDLFGANSAGTLNLDSAGALADANGVSLIVSGAGSLTAANALVLGDNAADVLTINGAATWSASSLALGSAGSANFGSLNFNSVGIVAIREAGNTLLVGNNTADQLDLQSSGFLRDDLGTSLVVNDIAELVATTDLTLSNSLGDTLSVGGAATVSGASISLGTVGTANFGTIRFNSPGGVNIREASNTLVFGTNSAETLTLNSSGSLSDDVNTTVNAAGAANLTAATTLTLADNAGDSWSLGGATHVSGSSLAVGLVGSANFGSLQYTSVGNVAVREGSATDLRAANSALNLDLISAGAITDQSGTTQTINGAGNWVASGSIVLADNATDALSVFGNASFVAPGADISVGIAPGFSPFVNALNQGNPDSGATVQFGTLSFDTANAGDTARGAVHIKEDSTTTLSGLARAQSVYLGTEGAFDETEWAALDLANPAGGDTNLFVDALNAVTLADTGGTTVSISGLAILRSRAATVDLGVDSGTGLDSGVSVTLNRLAVQSPGQVRVTADSGIVLDSTTAAGTLILVAGGTLTDTPDATATVTGNATITATGAIALADSASNNWNVGGLASWLAPAITIGTAGTVDFGSLNFQATGNVTIQEDFGMNLSGSLSGAQVTLSAAGPLTNSAGMSLQATSDLGLTANTMILANHLGDVITGLGQATFSAGAISVDTLGLVNFGTVRFISAGAVSIVEDSDLVVTGNNSANQLDLTATGSITDASGATIAVANALSVQATGTVVLADEVSNAWSSGTSALFAGSAITVGSAGTANFGGLNFSSLGAVSVQEDSATNLLGTNFAGSLDLNSAGSVTDAAGIALTVTTNASVTAGGTILVADSVTDQWNVGGQVNFQASAVTVAATGAANFGQVHFNSGGDVTIHEDSDLALAGTNTANNATLTSAGNLSDAAATSLTTTGGSSFVAAGTLILADSASDVLAIGGLATLNGSSIAIGPAGSVSFGTLAFSSPGAVAIAEDSATVLSGTSSANSLNLTSGGSITDAAGTSLTVTNAATLQAASSVTLADNVADTFSVGGQASWSGTALNLGAAGTANFGSLNFQSAGAVTIRENSGTEFFGNNNGNSLQVNSAGSITDAAAASIIISTNASLTAALDIQLNDQASDVFTVGGDASFNAANILITTGTAAFGSLQFVSAGLVGIGEDDAMVIRGTNSANVLVLVANGNLSDANGTVVTVSTNSVLQANGTLQLVDSATESWSVGGQLSLSTGGQGPVLIGVNPAFQPFTANFASVNPDSGGSANFGQIFCDTANAGDTVRQEVRIFEDSSSSIAAGSRASSLYLGTQGSLTDAQLSAINLASPQGGSSNLFFDAQGAIRIGETAGISINGMGMFRSATSTVEVGVTGGTFADSGQVVQFGGLMVQSPAAVRAVLDSNLVLQFTNNGASLALAGLNLGDGSGSSVSTTGPLQLVATNNILLGDGSSTVTLGAGELLVAATNATIELDSSANLGSSSISGVYHVVATNAPNARLVQTSGLVAANQAAFEASGAVVVRNAAINLVAIESSGSFSTVGIPLNPLVPASELPAAVAALIRNNGPLAIGTIFDPQTGTVVDGIRTTNGNIYAETLGAGNPLTVLRPVAAGNAADTLLLIAGGQFNLNAPLSRGNPATDGLVWQVAPNVLVENPFEFTQVTLFNNQQSVRFSYGQLGEQRFTVQVQWADMSVDTYAGNLPPIPGGATVVGGLQAAHPTGVSTIDVSKVTPYTDQFLLTHPLLSSTLTVFNDAQIQTYADGGTTDLNSASASFDATVSNIVVIVPPAPPEPTIGGFVLPEEEDVVQVINPDVRQPEFDDVQAAIGTQDDLAKLYSVFLDDPEAQKMDWPKELDVESIKKQILNSPNSVFRPGTYEIIRQKEGQEPEVLETFDKDVDPERNNNGSPSSPTTAPAVGQRRSLPVNSANATSDESVWIREWETWMVQGVFPVVPQVAPPAAGGDVPTEPAVPQGSPHPALTVAHVVTESAPLAGEASDAAETPTSANPETLQVSGSSWLIGGAAALLQLQQHWTQAAGQGRKLPWRTEQSGAGGQPGEPAFDKQARRKRRLSG